MTVKDFVVQKLTTWETNVITPAFRELASGLQFPEGPIAMPDGSVTLVEIRRQTLTRVTPSGQVEVIAKLGGGPNGAGMGPDGRILSPTTAGSTGSSTRRATLFP